MQRRSELFAWVSAVVIILFSGLALSQTTTEPSGTKLVALVIGNSAYKGNRLLGPDNDAIDMAKVLSTLGFQISNAKKITNLDRDSMYSVISNFIERIDKNTIAIVYYSGHGLEDSKENFLVPIDATLKTYGDLKGQLISLDWILTRLSQRDARTKIVILDACRNMPQALRFKSIGETGGLAEVKNLKPGTRIIYAASPESNAMSAPEGQRNSVFTAALLTAIEEKPKTFDEVINRAAELTLIATGNRQYPWSSGNLGMSFRISPQLPMNPLPQERAETLRRLGDSTGETLLVPCEEISELVVINLVSTWTKKCI